MQATLHPPCALSLSKHHKAVSILCFRSRLKREWKRQHCRSNTRNFLTQFIAALSNTTRKIAAELHRFIQIILTTLLIILLHDKITFELVRFRRILLPDCAFLETLFLAIQLPAFDIEVDANLEHHASKDDGSAVSTDFL